MVVMAASLKSMSMSMSTMGVVSRPEVCICGRPPARCGTRLPHPEPGLRDMPYLPAYRWMPRIPIRLSLLVDESIGSAHALRGIPLDAAHSQLGCFC